MKSQQKINFLFFLIIFGLIVALIVVSLQGDTHSKNSTPQQLSSFELMEIKINHPKEMLEAYGIVNSEVEVDVKMNVSGRIDNDNHSLRPGTQFKKNDLLIKVDRLEILYELLINRLNYKKLLQNSMQKIGEQFPKEKSKWQDFEGKIERTLPLPELPKTTSKEEENLMNELNVLAMYYTVKKIERKAEDYIYAAPFDGFISESGVSPSGMVKHNISLMKLSKSNTLQVVTHLPVQFVNEYELAEHVYFLNAQKDTLGKGSYKRTGAILSDSSKVEVYFTISQQNQSIQNSSVQIALPAHDKSSSVSLPKSAVINAKAYLFSDNKVIEVPVHVVSTTNDSVYVKGLPNPCFVIKEAEKALIINDKGFN